MIGESRLKKVDYSVMSDKKCKICGQTLKQNSVIKGHNLCYVCFKVSKGKKESIKRKLIDGKFVEVSRRNFVKEQRENINKFKS